VPMRVAMTFCWYSDEAISREATPSLLARLCLQPFPTARRIK